MKRTWRAGLLVAVVIGGVARPVVAQPPGLPPAPVPIVADQGAPNVVPAITVPTPQNGPGAPAVLPPITVPGGGTQPYVPTPPTFLPPGPVYPGRPAPEPMLPAGPPPPGLYSTLEVTLLFPQLRGWLNGPVNVIGVGPDVVELNSATLDSTGSPRLELGYRLADDRGAVALSYRSVVSQGSENIDNWDALGSGFQRSRLNFNLVDLDYISPTYHVLPFMELSWRAGLRGNATYFEHEVTGAFAYERASSNFIGGGGHAAIEIGHAFERSPGFGVNAKLDGGVVFGNIKQSFEEDLNFGDAGVYGGATNINTTQAVPMVQFTVGLTYAPPGCSNWARFGFGYEFEYWWNVGAGGAGSSGDLLTQGIYLRGEFNW